MTFLLSWCPRKNPVSHTISKNILQIECPSLPVHLYLSSQLPFTQYVFFLIILCSLPVNWLLVLPLDLWLTFSNPEIIKKVLELKGWATSQLKGYSSKQHNLGVHSVTNYSTTKGGWKSHGLEDCRDSGGSGAAEFSPAPGLESISSHTHQAGSLPLCPPVSSLWDRVSLGCLWGMYNYQRNWLGTGKVQHVQTLEISKLEI